MLAIAGGRAELVARRRVAPLLARAAELVIERPRLWRRVAGGVDVGPQRLVGARRSGPLAQVGGVDAGLGRGRPDQPLVVEQAAGHRADAQAAQQQRGGMVARVLADSDDRATCGLGAGRARIRTGRDRHPVAALQPRCSLGELLGLAGLERQHDHPQPPPQRVAVPPAQRRPHRFSRECERAGRIR